MSSIEILKHPVTLRSMSEMRRVTFADSEYDDATPIRIAPGDQVTVIGGPGVDFPAFVEIETADGTGWVPLRYLTADRPVATVTTAYDTTVLMPKVGDIVTVIADDVESGWSWCRGQDGVEGWVMNRALGAL